MASEKKARAIGFNHVALEVGDIDEALDFYGRFLDFELQSKSDTAAFIYLGDQFINFSKGRRQAPDDARHLGLVVDDKEAVRARSTRWGSRSCPALPRLPRPLGQPHRDRRLPEHPVHQGAHVLRGMGLAHLEKSQKALDELAKKGHGPRSCGRLRGRAAGSIHPARCLPAMSVEARCAITPSWRRNSTS